MTDNEADRLVLLMNQAFARHDNFLTMSGSQGSRQSFVSQARVENEKAQAIKQQLTDAGVALQWDSEGKATRHQQLNEVRDLIQAVAGLDDDSDCDSNEEKPIWPYT